MEETEQETSSVCLNFVTRTESSNTYNGSCTKQDKLILDMIYQKIFERIDATIFARMLKAKSANIIRSAYWLWLHELRPRPQPAKRKVTYTVTRLHASLRKSGIYSSIFPSRVESEKHHGRALPLIHKSKKSTDSLGDIISSRNPSIRSLSESLSIASGSQVRIDKVC